MELILSNEKVIYDWRSLLWFWTYQEPKNFPYPNHIWTFYRSSDKPRYWQDIKYAPSFQMAFCSVHCKLHSPFLNLILSRERRGFPDLHGLRPAMNGRATPCYTGAFTWTCLQGVSTYLNGNGRGWGQAILQIFRLMWIAQTQSYSGQLWARLFISRV